MDLGRPTSQEVGVSAIRIRQDTEEMTRKAAVVYAERELLGNATES